MVCNLSLLNFHHLSLITHHLKHFNFPNPLFGNLTQTKFSTSKVVARFHPKKKKKSVCQNIAAEYVSLITKILLKTESWKLKTTKMCWELSDGNNDPKLIQTNAHSWDPHDLDDENRILSDITQNSSHPNKLLITFSKVKIFQP